MMEEQPLQLENKVKLPESSEQEQRQHVLDISCSQLLGL